MTRYWDKVLDEWVYEDNKPCNEGEMAEEILKEVNLVLLISSLHYGEEVPVGTGLT